MTVKFQETVLNKVKQIPKGKVTTYGAIALELTGSVRAARAVGQAVAKNPYPITIPCHRVVRTDGDVGGYCFGADKKIELLRAEGIEITGGQVLNFERVLFLFIKQKKIKQSYFVFIPKL
jgi:methylated-DNA-[protein]-cysteine S-methyltransferase